MKRRLRFICEIDASCNFITPAVTTHRAHITSLQWIFHQAMLTKKKCLESEKIQNFKQGTLEKIQTYKARNSSKQVISKQRLSNPFLLKVQIWWLPFAGRHGMEKIDVSRIALWFGNTNTEPTTSINFLTGAFGVIGPTTHCSKIISQLLFAPFSTLIPSTAVTF